ncbi:MAG: hypothetical protein ABJN98_02990, partial [Roseibium sp.]
MRVADWLSTQTVANLAGVSDRMVRRVCSEFVSGKRSSWKGRIFVVRCTGGIGGRSGVRYEVSADSFCSLNPKSTVALGGVSQNEPSIQAASLNSSGSERNWWLTLLQPVFTTAPNTTARGKAMRRLAGKQTFDWRGKPFSPSLRQIQRRCAAFKREQSISALSRRARSDRGKSRCYISRAWDRAVSGRFDDEIKAEIADGLRQQVRGLVKGGATGKIVAELACEYLKKVTVANGIH